MNINIFYENDTERDELETMWKGWRGDVIVQIDDKRYKIFVVSITRLQQDFHGELGERGFYESEPNMIIVNEVTKQEIEDTVNRLILCKYFERVDNRGFDTQ